MNIVLIAEKPSVARTYADALDLENKKNEDGYISGKSKWDGNDYRVTWCVGHLVTLSYPEKYDEKLKNWNLDDLPFLPEKYKYEVIKTVSKQFNVIKALYNDPKCDRIIYGGDPAREGAYIQALVRMLAKTNGHATEMMLWIDSQTEDEIRRGLSNLKPFANYEKLIMAGYMRAIEDYAIGLNYSRLLSLKYGSYYNSKTAGSKYKAISVGRVMTCVLGMVVDKENEIRNFTETLYYKIFANCSNKEFEFSADWLVDKDSKYFNSPLLYDNKGFLAEKDADVFASELNGYGSLRVISVTKKNEKKKPPLLFNLAELQSKCSKNFKISPKDTLNIAQKLYETGLTSYPRTDARYLSSAICKELGDILKKLNNGSYNTKFIKQILNLSLYSDIEKTQYCNDSKITDHYAIIPTGKTDTSSLSDLELKVYQLIVDRFVCIFLPSAEYCHSSAVLQADNDEKFSIHEKALLKTGYLEVLKEDIEDDVISDGDCLADFIKENNVFKAEFFKETGKTAPPKRYTTGSMILAMENAGNLIEEEELRAQIKGSGIGTSATRAEIIDKLQSSTVGYISVNKKTQTITPTDDGETVYQIVKDTMPQLLSPKMTASWEKGLSKIEDGTTTREEYTKILYKEIEKIVKKVKGIATPQTEKFTPEDTSCKCPFCGGTIETTKNGYKCVNNVYKEKDSCPFFVGTRISVEELSNLVTAGRTGMIDGFKKKDGKGTFSARLVIDGNERKVNFEFDKPDNNETDTGLKCPYCGGEVVSAKFGYKCRNNIYKDDSSCPFFLGKISGKELSEEDLKKLIKEGRTDKIDGFAKKSGKGTFSATLVLNKEKKKVEFDFL